jgi:hypothetical protein
MNHKMKPIHKPGERNIYCPYYSECLDYVIQHSWETWNCSQCPCRFIQQPNTDYGYEACDTDPAYDLPLQVYGGGVWSIYYD